MIVCKQCGHHNQAGETFCESCGSFLEWTGERLADDSSAGGGGAAGTSGSPASGGAGTGSRAGGSGSGSGSGSRAGGSGSGTGAAPTGSGPPSGPGSPGPGAGPQVAGGGPGAASGSASGSGPGAAAGAPGRGTGSGAGSAPTSTGSASGPGPGPGAAATTGPTAGTRGAPPPFGQGNGAPPTAEANAASGHGGLLPPPSRDEEARRRAAALVARVRETPPEPTTAAPPTPSTPSTPTGPPPPPVGSRPPTGPVPPGPAAGAGAGERQPGAQLPGAEQARTAPAAKEAPTKRINPGDIICPKCGEGNEAGRQFCRRCGTSLVVAPVVTEKRPGWFKRTFGRKPKEPATLAAGARPMRGGGGRGGDVGRGARAAKSGILGGAANARRLLAVLAIVGIGAGVAIPSIRTKVSDGISSGIDSVKRLIKPEYTTVRPSGASASVNAESANLLVDGAKNSHWSVPGDGDGATITVTFEQPTTIDRIGITPGNQDEAQTFNSARSPKDVSVALDGRPPKQITLEDNPNFQNFELGGKATTVTLTINSCYASPQGGNDCAIAELEFFKKK